MLTNLPQYLANARKAIIQFLTLVITLGTAVATYSNLPDKYAALITAVVGVAGTALHYATSNAPAPGSGTAEDPYIVTSLDDDASDAADAANPDFQPAALVTADQVASSVPPDLATPDTTPATATPAASTS